MGSLVPAYGGITLQALHIQNGVDQPLSNVNFMKGIQDLWPETKGKGFIQEEPFLSFILKTSNALIARQNHSYPITQHEIMNLKDAVKLKRYFKENSFYVNRRMSDEELSRIAHVFQTIPSNVIVTFDTQDGAIHNVPKDATAFVHRSSTNEIVVNRNPVSYDESEVPVGMEWVQEFLNTVQPLDNGESYQNYPDSDLEANGLYLQRYYGSNLERLISVKQKWDPKNYFNGPASIPVQTTTATQAQHK